MLKSTEGIVTRITKYGESSLILDLLTPDDGLRSFIISGVRSKSGRKKSSIVQILNLVKIEAYIRGGDHLSRIKEISYAHIYKSIPFNIIKSSLATFLIEVCRNSVKASDNYAEVYHYIVKAMIHLDNVESNLQHFHIGFLIGLTKYLGIEFENNYSESRPYFNLKEGKFESQLSEHRFSLDQNASLHLSNYTKEINYNQAGRKERQVLLNGIIDFYRYHIDGFGQIKSLDVLLTLFSD